MRHPGVYPSDVSDEEWTLAAPYLCLMKQDAPQRVHPLRAVFTGESVQVACVDMGYNGEQAAAVAAEQGVRLEVVSLPEAKKGFVLLPRRRVIERSFAWPARRRRLSRDYERLATTLAGLHYVAAAMLMLTRLLAELTHVQMESTMRGSARITPRA